MRRTSVTAWSGIGLGLLAATVPALGADATAGKTLFRQQCSICHTAEPGDNGGAQGPSLLGVFGRPAASGAGFSYTEALRAAHLTWDAPTLARFLASPTTAVPGSTMVIAVPSAIKTFNWLGTLWGGNIRFTSPMLFALGSLAIFVIGGLTGVFNSSLALDIAQRGTFFVVGHFHVFQIV